MERLLSPRTRDAHATNELLLTACSKGDDRQVARLLQRGANVFYRDRHGRTALHKMLGRVVFPSDPDLLRRLLEARADLHAPDQGGNTPLHEACRYNKPVPVGRILNEHVDAINQFGNTPLHVAAVNASHQCLQMLARLPVDPFVRNTRGQQPLDLTNRADVTKLIHRALKKRIMTFLLALSRQSDPIYTIDPYLVEESFGPDGYLFRYIAPGTMW
eukprot:EG_transcript_20301